MRAPEDHPRCARSTRPPADAVAGCLLGRNYWPRRIRAQTTGGAADTEWVEPATAPAGCPGAAPDRCGQIGRRNQHLLPAHPPDLEPLGFRPAEATGRTADRL